MRINTESRFVQLLGSIALGYAINFVLALVVLFIFDVDVFFKPEPKDFYGVLEVAFYASFYGMGLGLLIEMVFKGKAWREKLPIYFLAILCSPSIIFFVFIDQNFIFFLSMPLWGALATSIYMYFKSFGKVDILSYAVGYIFIFLGLLLASFFWSIINEEGDISPLYAFIFFNLLSPVIGVRLCKLFFRRIKYEKR